MAQDSYVHCNYAEYIRLQNKREWWVGAKNRGVGGVVAAQCWFVLQQREGGWNCVKLCGVMICGGVQVPTTKAPRRHSYPPPKRRWRARSTAPAPAAADVGGQTRERWPRRARAACGVVGEWWFA